MSGLNGFSPYFFGPVVWDTMLIYAMNFPDMPSDQQQKDMLLWITKTMEFLPCPSCSMHAKEYVIKHVPNVSCRAKLVEYIVEFHNYVNLQMGKATMSIDEAKSMLIERLKESIDTKTYLPRAMEIRREDHVRITNLQNKVAKLTQEAQVYDANTHHSIYFYSTIGLSIFAGLLLIALIVVAVRGERRIRKLIR